MHRWHGRATGGSPAVPRWVLVLTLLAGVLAMLALSGPGEHHLGMPGTAEVASQAGSMAGAAHHVGSANTAVVEELATMTAPGLAAGGLVPMCLAILFGMLLLGLVRRTRWPGGGSVTTRPCTWRT